MKGDICEKCGGMKGEVVVRAQQGDRTCVMNLCPCFRDMDRLYRFLAAFGFDPYSEAEIQIRDMTDEKRPN